MSATPVRMAMMSTAMVSVVSTLNRAYDIQDSRAWWKVRLTAIALTILQLPHSRVPIYQR